MFLTTCSLLQSVKNDEFPVIHEDGTSPNQTVRQEEHPDLHKLPTEFHKKTGCPMLLNTSLNIKGQPIVNDEEDAKALQTLWGKGTCQRLIGIKYNVD